MPRTHPSFRFATLERSLRDRRVWYWGLFVLVAFLGTRKIFGHDSDLTAVLVPARELGSGLDLYRARDALPPYPYPPWVAGIFALPMALLPTAAIEILFGMSQGFAAVILVSSLERIGRAQIKIQWWHWLLFAVIFGRAIDQNLTHGQLSLWVSALMTRAVVDLIDRRESRAGLLLGVAAAMKLTPLLYLVALPFMRRWRAALWMASAIVLLVFVLPWPFLGSEAHFRHLADFRAAMLDPLFDHSAGQPEIWSVGEHNIRGTVSTLLMDVKHPEGLPMPTIVALPPATVAAVVVIYSALIALLLACGFWRFRRGPPAWTIAWQASLVMLAITFFAPLTRVYHLAGVTLPVMLFVLHGPGRGARRWTFVAICAGLLITMPLRQRALLGEPLWHWLHFSGVLHFSLVGVLVWIVTLPLSSPHASPDRVPAAVA